MIALAIIVCVWLACSVGSYLVWRTHDRKKYARWTNGDRLFSIYLSLIGGPISLCIALKETLPKSGYLDKPARW